MARKEWELLFNLSAKQNSSFSSTFKAAQSALVETQGKIQQLNKVQSDISAYQKQQQAVDATRQRLSVLQQQYDNIQKEIQETEGYSSALENKLISKQAQIDKTAASLNTYEQRLAATGNALHEAGVDTTQLTAESVRLETEVDKLKDQQVDLKRPWTRPEMAQRDSVKNRSMRLRRSRPRWPRSVFQRPSEKSGMPTWTASTPQVILKHP